ncbi:hypothetical protein AYI70_g8232 [Smittium culicis]|uniref:Uncharacterized protein n=1 Tax=Smittium culicis TaxID=133412 RepID=A0A1R1X8H8_9FUNG|nr:hypothetical protein AYI70_g10011 [Smittium culicis]OMJ13889.1 hypothetical protein AYI70_g8232 [Smittium culicis]
MVCSSLKSSLYKKLGKRNSQLILLGIATIAGIAYLISKNNDSPDDDTPKDQESSHQDSGMIPALDSNKPQNSICLPITSSKKSIITFSATNIIYTIDRQNNSFRFNVSPLAYDIISKISKKHKLILLVHANSDFEKDLIVKSLINAKILSTESNSTPHHSHSIDLDLSPNPPEASSTQLTVSSEASYINVSKSTIISPALSALSDDFYLRPESLANSSSHDRSNNSSLGIKSDSSDSLLGSDIIEWISENEIKSASQESSTGYGFINSPSDNFSESAFDSMNNNLSSDFSHTSPKNPKPALLSKLQILFYSSNDGKFHTIKHLHEHPYFENPFNSTISHLKDLDLPLNTCNSNTSNNHLVGTYTGHVDNDSLMFSRIKSFMPNTFLLSSPEDLLNDPEFSFGF